MTKRKTRPARFYVATYGDLGLEVEFFTAKRPFEAAVKHAESEHDKGELDTYTYGDVPGAPA